MHCNKLISANLTQMQAIKENLAESEAAREQAQQAAQSDAARARDAEAQVQRLQSDLVATNAELGAALEEMDEAEFKVSRICSTQMSPEIIAQEEFLSSPLRVNV